MSAHLVATATEAKAGPPFRRILIANRGEIAVRVARTCRAMGIESVAVYSEPDANSAHVQACDQAVALGGRTAAESYLVTEAILRAARDTGADAIHPGYGFLSENEAFAKAVAAAGITFIGPHPDTIRTMGSKTGARSVMEAAGVPVIPGYQGDDMTPERLAAEAVRIGFPLLVKAVFGGGGKGMRVVRALDELAGAVGEAQREAVKAFGRGDVFLERYLEEPRHIEVQVLGDGHGGAIHVFERECSIQRRHQKVIEESPSAALTVGQREAICETGRKAAAAVSYLGAGTVELIVARDGSHFFLEMNTRLQVEHPVTEMVSGVDLVEAQIRLAAGEGLAWPQGALKATGHAIECRLYAEDPENGFLPSIGTLVRFRAPEAPWIRFDCGVREGDEVTPLYDPMLAKLVVWGPDRAAAIQRTLAALDELQVHGVRTNTAFLRHVIGSEEFAATAFHTRWVDDAFQHWRAETTETQNWALLAGLALAEMASAGAGSPGAMADSQSGGRAAEDPFYTLAGWRLSAETGGVQ